jgi:putative tricarboxylic transport membrane protein
LPGFSLAKIGSTEGDVIMHEPNEADEVSLASNRTLEIAVAIALLAISSIIIYDSLRLGIGWAEGEGPRAGYFPFYIAVVLATASVAILIKAVLSGDGDLNQSFVSRQAFGRVLTVLIPAIGYVAAVQFIGFYAASAAFLLLFMRFVGGESLTRAVAVALGVPLFFFFMFERWFLVPLPKGPIEAILGY